MTFCLLFSLLMLLTIEFSLAGIVRRNSGVEVRNGRTVLIRDENLSFNVNPGLVCKVQVVNNEPMQQKVGVFSPPIFDCNYPAGLVKYEHNGSPLLRDDIIKMRAYLLLGNHTMQETFSFRVSVVDSRCDVIRINRVPLVVPNLQKKSNPVTRDVVDFDYDRNYDLLCHVRVFQNGFPRYGRLVAPKNSNDSINVEYVAVDNLRETCEDFVLMKLRYEHLSPPTPNLDYIPLHVQVSDRVSGSLLIDERHWLPIRINGAFPNQPPKSSFSNMYILEVDQFILTNLLPMTVSATDSETSNERLMFNITKPPSQGFITHLQDQSKPISSFLQQDLQDLQIAYQPPNISFDQRQTFEAEFVVFDEYFAKSDPIRVLFSVRVAYTNAPRVSWNKGLTMLEGQSRTIDNNCLQIVDKDNLHQVRFTLAGGLRHGRLYIQDKPGFSFSWDDVVNGLVSYRHDDTDTRSDFIAFRITDRSHSIRFKLPISILPKDDSPPFLINNIAFEVQEGQMILIHRFMLEASDADTASDYITFNITTPPRAGEVQKKRKWERAGYSVNHFLQSDLYQGLVYYKHLGNEQFQDSFEFILIDRNRPFPNTSPIQRVEIKITPVDDLYPEPGPGNSLVLTVNETDVIPWTYHHLHFRDIEQNDPDVTFTITKDLFRLDGSARDAGKLIFTDDMIMLMKDPSVPILRTFTQSAVNHSKVAYMPPINDIGQHPVDVQFVFMVTDDSGKQLTGKTFAITVLPVDNQTPTIKVTSLCLLEGGTEILAADLILLSDEDTDPARLQIFLTQLPKTGSLRRDNIVLNLDDSFTLHDVENFRITYIHNGSEIHTDSFELTVSDGIQNSSVIMPVNMEPVDDEGPVIEGLNISLHVPESGSAVLLPTFLSATDIDTEDEDLIFEVLVPPQLGSLRIDGNVVTTFRQYDITNGRLEYVHGGAEVGKDPLHDSATIMVSDRRGQPISEDEYATKTKDLHFTITPVNSRPPRVALGHRVFQCDEGNAETISQNYLVADDEDTPTDQLRYLIEAPPVHGYIEDITPQPGFQTKHGVRTTSFTHNQLLNGHIRYKQSEHRGVEPTSDQFTISVTDGQYKSATVPFLISITPTNDEEPIISIENVTCNEGFMKVLSLKIIDLDMPKDEVMISVTQSPNHGMIMDEVEMLSRMRRSTHERPNHTAVRHAMHHMEAMSEFSLRQLKENRVIPAYMNDGSEFGSDEFEMKFTDGKHVSKQMLTVKVMPVNDEKPRIVINNGITLEFGESKIISGVALQAVDDDTSSSELIYEILSLPRRGKLQLLTDDINWTDLDFSDSFTEADVEMNRLRYVHTSVLGSKGKDSFRFLVSDGDFTSRRQNFQIRIENTKKNVIHVVTNPMRVNEGEKVFLTTDQLTATDGSKRPQDIIYDVIRQPIFGHIEYLAYPNVTIEMFTQLDLLARSVIYVHTSKEDSSSDTFRVMASNGLKNREAEISILISTVDSELPTLVLGRSTTESSVSSPVSLLRGSSVSISQMIIRIEDPDSPKDNLKLNLTSLPNHGTLSLKGVNILNVNKQISQTDLEASNFFYQHDGSNADIDSFSFTVTDGVHPHYYFKGVRTEEPTTLHLNIEDFDDVPPEVVINRIPNLIQPIGNGRSYSIPIDNHVLKAVDESMDDPSEITYSIVAPPSYGIIKLQSNSRRFIAAQRFTQLDLNERKVHYVISGKLNVTNDSFLFDVEDSWGNVLTGQRFLLKWSRVQMIKRKVKVCESASSILVKVKRYGNIDTSSFISVSVKKQSATLGDDFRISSAQQLQFDPNTAMKSWSVEILSDNLEERNEKFTVRLNAPINCVLIPQKTSTVVTILDQSHRQCRRRNSAGRFQTKKKSRIINDSPTVRTETEQTPIRYGKLPPGVTVSPQSFFRNGSTRIWRFHGILPVSTGELNRREEIFDRKSSGNIHRTVEEDRNQNHLSDDPQALQQQNNLVTRRMNIANQNVSAVVSVRGQNNARRSQRTQLQSSIRDQCVFSNTGRLFYDVNTRMLYQCNGASWIPWKRPRKNPQNPVNPTTPTCGHGWNFYKNKCYLVGSSSGGSSWNSAQRSCREQHSANLATITGKKMLKYLWKVSDKSRFWIGLNRKVNPRMWEWASGDPSSFTNWKRRYPNSSIGKDCVAVASKGRWINSFCNRLVNIKYVCEKSP